MDDRSKNWVESLRVLFNELGIRSTREAEEWCGHIVSSTYIGSWLRGKIPQYPTALAFLANVPADKRALAADCLFAAGYPMPKEWESPLNRIRNALRDGRVASSSIERIMAIVEEEIGAEEVDGPGN